MFFHTSFLRLARWQVGGSLWRSLVVLLSLPSSLFAAQILVSLLFTLLVFLGAVATFRLVIFLMSFFSPGPFSPTVLVDCSFISTVDK